MSELMQAIEQMLEVLPAYFGLAVPLKGEEDEFNAAEAAVSNAFMALHRAHKNVRAA